MTVNLKLKNAPDEVLVDEEVYQWLTSNPEFKKLDLVNNLRKHSSGCVVYQKTVKEHEGEPKIRTLYLHKIIAEQYLIATKTDKKKLVGAINGNKMDCRLENLVYRSRASASRNRKPSSKTGFAGVYEENDRYRAVISINGKPKHIGMFETAAEAATAYRKVSKKLFGE